MIILIANINGSVGLEEVESASLNSEIKNLGLELPKKVFSEKDLLNMLEDKKDNECILFTNFPPDSSYPGSGKQIKITDKGDYYNRSWDADSYEISHALFRKIVGNYNLKAIHFLTGAPESMISDKMLTYFSSSETVVTVTRRKELMAKVSEYPRLYKQFVLEKVKETINK